MEIIEKDILTVETGFIFQQVNCQGVMGSGIAKSIRDKWPQVFTDYKNYCDTFAEIYKDISKIMLLGCFNQTQVGEKLWVVNLFSQFDYNRKGEIPTKHTEYSAFYDALEGFRDFSHTNHDYDDLKLPKYFPYNIGCDRGGGKWETIQKCIDIVYSYATICKLPK
jgi:hypothetical protein